MKYVLKYEDISQFKKIQECIQEVEHLVEDFAEIDKSSDIDKEFQDDLKKYQNLVKRPSNNFSLIASMVISSIALILMYRIMKKVDQYKEEEQADIDNIMKAAKKCADQETGEAIVNSISEILDKELLEKLKTLRIPVHYQKVIDSKVWLNIVKDHGIQLDENNPTHQEILNLITSLCIL